MSNGFERSVAIGPEFFDKAKNDYQDWYWAIAREFMQNCIDAPGSKNIDVTIERQDEDTRLTVTNDGAPMDEDTLTNKLLALGGSGKKFQGTVGGFGKAKEILYFCHKSYVINTGPHTVYGSGAGYNLKTDATNALHGTSSHILLQGDETSNLKRAFTRFAKLSQWRGSIKIDGELVEERLLKGKGRKDLDFGRVYTNKSHSNIAIIRINGTPMFTTPTGYSGCVVLELFGTSLDVLQSSRDGLKWRYADQLSEFITNLSVNKRAALKSTRVVTTHQTYDGYELAGQARRAEEPAADPMSSIVESLIPVVGIADTAGDLVPAGEAPELGDTGSGTRIVLPHDIDGRPAISSGGAEGTSRRVITVPIRPKFTIKNETGLKIPAWFLPGDEFSGYSRKLTHRWIGCLLTIANLVECDKPFSIGFVFTEDGEDGCKAQYEVKDGESVLYINPARVVRHPGRSPVIQTRIKFDSEGNYYIMARAAHEFVHHMGYSSHDEDYAGALTNMLALVVRERTRFAKIFQTKVSWPEGD